MPLAELAAPPWADGIIKDVGSDLGISVLNLVRALLILAVGWVIAWGFSSLVKGLLKRTDIDNKIAQWFVGDRGDNPPAIEDWTAAVIYWLVLLFAVIAALDALNLKQVSAPLQSLLNQVTSFLPQVGGAGLLLGFAWLLATGVKLLVLQALRTARIDERLGEQTGEAGGDQLSLAETIGNTLYWFIFLLFLPSILSTLQLEGTLAPVQELLNQVLAILPNIFGAVLIGFVGWLIAQVVRRVVTNLLAATGVDQTGAKFGFTGGEENQKVSWILGTVVYVLVLIPVAISALQALKIEAISEPAIAMLEQVLATLPQIATAAAVLGVAYIAGNYISEFVTTVLTGFGFNDLPDWLGFATPSNSPVDAASSTPPEPEGRTPSEIVGTIVWVGIMLVATLTAVDILAINALTDVVGGIVQIAGQVLIGAVIFMIGLYLANLAFKLLTMSGTRQANMVGHAARIAIIIFVSAMALQQMGIATNIVNLAFGLLGGAIAVAVAIAFGLGGRDIAAEQVRAWLDDFNRND
ncbi:MAG: mechanosensitive ion channel [Spirulina sp. SIO3F2]|nr:mechanosensitive ion channel [Spirulina sp. SIO3F2]